MLGKAILIGTFIKKKNILSFMEQLHNEFHIPYYAQYVYKIENNKKEYLITFKTYNKLELS